MKGILRALFTVFTCVAQAAVGDSAESATKAEAPKQAPLADRFNFRIEPHWIAIYDEIAIDFQIRV